MIAPTRHPNDQAEHGTASVTRTYRAGTERSHRQAGRVDSVEGPEEIGDIIERLVDEFEPLSPVRVARAVAESRLALRAAGVEFGLAPATEAAARFRLRSGERVAERPDLHNGEVDECIAVLGLCGTIHLPSGRLCLRHQHHEGSCQFRSRSAHTSPTTRRPSMPSGPL